MLKSEIKVGKTYVGRGLEDAPISNRLVVCIFTDTPTPILDYERVDGIVRTVNLSTFARWADREAWDAASSPPEPVRHVTPPDDGSDYGCRYCNAQHDGPLEDWEVEANTERERKMSEAVKFESTNGGFRTEIVGAGSPPKGDRIVWSVVKLGEAFRDNTGDLWLAVGDVPHSPHLAARLLNLRTLRDVDDDLTIEKMILTRVNLLVNVTQG